MATSVTNLIMGPGTLYSGAFGATEPLDSAVSTAPSDATWTDCGGTDGGVKLVVDQKYKELSVDQIVDRVGSRLTSREFVVETDLAEPTLDNLALALNGGTVTDNSGYSTYEPVYAQNSASQPTYAALILDGYAPQQFRRRVIVRKTLSTDKVESSYVKDKQTFLSVKFTGHYVSTSIAPIHIVDQTA